MPIIRIVDYVPFPGGRYETDGPYSGEFFRENHLLPALRNAISHGTILEVELDGVPNYGVSFLEECFGGLIQVNQLTSDQLKRHLHIVACGLRYEVFCRIINKIIT